jgi:hypothetical protein
MLNTLPFAKEEDRVALGVLFPRPEELQKQWLEFFTNAGTNPQLIPQMVTAMVSALLPPTMGARIVGTVRRNGDEPAIYLSAGWYKETELQTINEQIRQSLPRGNRYRSAADINETEPAAGPAHAQARNGKGRTRARARA